MKTTVETLLGVTVVTKCRVGFLIATVAVSTIAGEAVLRRFDFLARNDVLVFIGVGLLGFIVWLAGRVREARSAESTPVQDPPVGEADVEHPLAFLGNLKYWGSILVVLAATLSCFSNLRQQKPVVLVHARPLPVNTVTVTNVITNVVTIPNVAPRLVFPSLQLHGVVVNGSKSSAVINGRVLWLGEAISNAVLVAVDSEHVLMAMEGHTNILTMRK